MKFEPLEESIRKHEVPQWYQDAKFGIFIHWSLFSIPAWAPGSGKNLAELSEEDEGFANSMKNSPYAEWYLNTSRIEGSPTNIHHKEVYGKEFDYFDFQKQFEEQNRSMNAEKWADFFKESGAKYVVLVTKHHDGYCLWPSEYKNPFMREYQSKRDLVGEITEAVRSRDMKMGLYYSGIFDWTFKHYPIDGMENWVNHHIVTDEYSQYALNQTKELIHKYKPSILWNDIGYPAQCDLNELFAEYYNTVPEGVINDRWRQYSISSEEEKKKLVDKLNDQLEKGGIGGILVTDGFCDYTSPEYADEMKLQKKKWELTRGIGMSFGYNTNEDTKHMLKGKDIIYMLIDTVSKNGNLLLNVGPRPDGTIQEEQKMPLLETGKWLQINGEAIYGTTYWHKQESLTTDDKPVRFTRKGKALYAMIMCEDVEGSITIKDVEIPQDAEVTLLGEEGRLKWQQEAEGLTVKLPEAMKKQYAYTLKIEG